LHFIFYLLIYLSQVTVVLGEKLYVQIETVPASSYKLHESVAKNLGFFMLIDLRFVLFPLCICF